MKKWIDTVLFRVDRINMDDDYPWPRFLDFAKNVENSFAITVVGFGFPDSVTSFTKDVYIIELRAMSCQVASMLLCSSYHQ